MRSALFAVALASLAASAAAAPKPAAKPPPPAPVAAAAAKPGPADWRTPNPDDILVIDTNKGRIIVEMIPEVSPLFTARVRDLARAHFYDGLTFFRVIEGFMAQTGDPENRGTGGSKEPDLHGEFTFRRGPDTAFVLAADQSVAEIGFIKSLPVMTQSMMLAPLTRDGKISGWGLYCPGVAGAARGEDEASANSQFFLMRDGYPSLEKRYTAWGRVIVGQEVVRAIKVGEPAPDPQDRMARLRVLSELPENEQPKIRVANLTGPWFKAELARVRAARGADFTACDITIPTEVK